MLEFELRQYLLRKYPQDTIRHEWIFYKWSDTLLEDAYCDIKPY